MTVQPKAGELARYQLEDRYTQEKGRVFMTGTQALVRAVLDQARRDRASGLNTAGIWTESIHGAPPSVRIKF